LGTNKTALMFLFSVSLPIFPCFLLASFFLMQVHPLQATSYVILLLLFPFPPISLTHSDQCSWTIARKNCDKKELSHIQLFCFLVLHWNRRFLTRTPKLGWLGGWSRGHIGVRMVGSVCRGEWMHSA
jgi:hypothetical protein